MFHCCLPIFTDWSRHARISRHEELTHLRVRVKAYVMKRFFHFFFFFFSLSKDEKRFLALSLCLPVYRGGVLHRSWKSTACLRFPLPVICGRKTTNLTDNGMFNIVNVANTRSSFLCVSRRNVCRGGRLIFCIFRERSIGECISWKLRMIYRVECIDSEIALSCWNWRLVL